MHQNDCKEREGTVIRGVDVDGMPARGREVLFISSHRYGQGIRMPARGREVLLYGVVDVDGASERLQGEGRFCL